MGTFVVVKNLKMARIQSLVKEFVTGPARQALRDLGQLVQEEDPSPRGVFDEDFLTNCRKLLHHFYLPLSYHYAHDAAYDDESHLVEDNDDHDAHDENHTDGGAD